MSEALLRIVAFAGVFLLLAVFELVRPRRRLTASKLRRWTTNLAIIGIDGAVVSAMARLAVFAVPLAGTSAVVYADAQGFGILNAVAWPAWLEFLIAVIVLDLAIWFQHLVTHHVPLLWRLHQVHHADIDFDVTTAIRFHPVEIALSMVWKVAVVLALGASFWAVLAFEIILNACAMFSHANISLPGRLDAALRWLMVTPDMHRVHHSVLRHERNSNYGFNLSVWDRVFGTYQAQPGSGHDAMTIGLPGYQSDEPTRLIWSIILPFKRGSDAIRKD